VFTEALLRNSRYASLVGSLPGNASSYTLQYPAINERGSCRIQSTGSEVVCLVCYCNKFNFSFHVKASENHELGTGSFMHRRIISAVKRVEFVSDRMSYIILRDL
jgi:hypothetical protein